MNQSASSASSAVKTPASPFAGVRTVTMLLDEDVVEALAAYAAVHRMSVGEFCREIVLEKICPQRAEFGAAA